LIIIESKNDKYLEVPMYLDVIQHTFIDQTLEIALQFDIKPGSLLNQLRVLCTSEKYKKKGCEPFNQGNGKCLLFSVFMIAKLTVSYQALCYPKLRLTF